MKYKYWHDWSTEQLKNHLAPHNEADKNFDWPEARRSGDVCAIADHGEREDMRIYLKKKEDADHAAK